MTEPVLEHISIADLDPHPDNPRITYREDVVEGIRVSLEQDGFSVEHALKVRPLNGRYQIVSGHQRTEAARLAGIESVPVWVRERSDEDAFMDLVRDNAQGELSPLEYGMHALSSVPTAQGVEGEGLAAYADQIGKGKSYISRLRDAAEVYSSLVSPGKQVVGMAKHLYEISRAPRDKWEGLVHALTAHKWTVQETTAQVNRIEADAEAERKRQHQAEQAERDAQTFIQANAPELAARVTPDDLGTYKAAYSVWESQNRDEAERIARDKAIKASREREHREKIARYASMISMNLQTWNHLQSVASGRDPNRDEIVAALNPSDRKKFLHIEKGATWPSTMI